MSVFEFEPAALALNLQEFEAKRVLLEQLRARHEEAFFVCVANYLNNKFYLGLSVDEVRAQCSSLDNAQDLNVLLFDVFGLETSVRSSRVDNLLQFFEFDFIWHLLSWKRLGSLLRFVSEVKTTFNYFGEVRPSFSFAEGSARSLLFRQPSLDFCLYDFVDVDFDLEFDLCSCFEPLHGQKLWLYDLGALDLRLLVFFGLFNLSSLESDELLAFVAKKVGGRAAKVDLRSFGWWAKQLFWGVDYLTVFRDLRGFDFGVVNRLRKFDVLSLLDDLKLEAFLTKAQSDGGVTTVFGRFIGIPEFFSLDPGVYEHAKYLALFRFVYGSAFDYLTYLIKRFLSAGCGVVGLSGFRIVVVCDKIPEIDLLPQLYLPGEFVEHFESGNIKFFI